MIHRAYIQELGHGRMEPEQQCVRAVLTARGLPVRTFLAKELARARLPLNPGIFVAGDHNVMATVLKRLGMSAPADCYPAALRSYLGRAIWETTVGVLLARGAQDEWTPVFIKPRVRTKLFTGCVLRTPYDGLLLEGYSPHTALYASEVVHWRAEFRVFVQGGAIAGIRHYAGDADASLNHSLLASAVADMEASPARTAAYALDFGVLEDGRTALVEWNDAFALGSYGWEAEAYTGFLMARWNELAQTIGH